MPAAFIHPPPEILHEIFLRALPHPDLVDPTACICVKSTWNAVTRQKKSIILVCRAWYDTGLPFLYQDICIWRVHQLPHLYHTLTETQIGIHVRRIRITTEVPNPTMQPLFENLLARLFSLCPSLSSLEFIDWCGLPLSRNVLSSIQIVPNITHLSLSESTTMNPDVVGDLLATVRETLTHLYIYDFLPTTPAISFPSLIDLTIVEPPPTGSSDNCRICTGGLYCFPALRRVKFVSGGWASITGTILEFCKQFGKCLNVLQIVALGVIGAFHVRWRSINPAISIQQILDVCPELEHVVLQPNTAIPLHHPRIQWVDLVEHAPAGLQSTREVYQNLRKNITTENFPQLKGVRTISILLQTLHPGIPVIIPPSMSQEPGFVPCSFVFDSGLHIRHEVGRIFSPLYEDYEAEVDPDVDPDVDSNVDSDADPSYSPSSSEGESDEEDEDEIEEDFEEESEGLIDCDLLETWLALGS